MAGEVTFSKATTETKTAPVNIEPKDKSTQALVNEEVPYMDYSRQNPYPHTVDFFGLGDKWGDPIGGFPKEVEVIENYFKERIESGEMANSTKAVKDRLKEILKVTNMNKEERNVIKVATVAAYMKFLGETEDVKHNVTRYGRA